MEKLKKTFETNPTGAEQLIKVYIFPSVKNWKLANLREKYFVGGWYSCSGRTSQALPQRVAWVPAYSWGTAEAAWGYQDRGWGQKGR